MINVAKYCMIYDYDAEQYIPAPYTFQTEGNYNNGGYDFYLEGKLYWVAE
jgi:hypothetical protein